MLNVISNDYLQSIYQLKNLVRYNTRLRLKDETVAEHSFYVSLLVLKLCEIYNLDEDITYKCLVMAVLHDMPEIELNDITHDVKERLNLRPMLKTYEDEYFKKNFKKYSALLYSQGIEKTIVDIADAYSVKQYVLSEMTLGNKSKDMTDIYNEIENRINTLLKVLHKTLGVTYGL